MRPLRSVRAFLECFFRLRAQLQTGGSPLGVQLEILKNSEKNLFVRRDDGDAHRAAHGALDRIAFYGILVRIWSTLNLPEQHVLELKNTPRTFVKHDHNGHRIENTPDDAQVFITREVRLVDMQPGNGISLNSLQRDENNKLTGWCYVDDTEVRCWNEKEIATQLRITVRMVRFLCQSGARRIVEHPLFQALNEENAVAA